MATTAPAKEPATWSTMDYRVCTLLALPPSFPLSLPPSPVLSCLAALSHGVQRYFVFKYRGLEAHVFTSRCNATDYPHPPTLPPLPPPPHSVPFTGSSKWVTCRKPSPFTSKGSGCTSTVTRNLLPGVRLRVMALMVAVGVRRW